MWRKKERIPSDLQGVDQRLRAERPQATPLELDQVKRTAMSRADASAPRSTFARRFVVAGLTVGLVAAGTGGVIAAGYNGGGYGKSASGSEYSSTVTTTVTLTVSNVTSVNINIGNGNTFTCSQIGIINAPLTCSIGTGGNVTVTATVSSAASSAAIVATSTSSGSGGVLGTQEKVKVKARTSSRELVVHPGFSKKYKLATETVTINGKAYKFFLHGKSAITVSFKGDSCSTSTQHVKITAVTTKGKVLTESRTYKLCIA